MLKIIFFSIIALSSLQCRAQAPASAMKSNHFFDGILSLGGNKVAGCLAWSHLHGIGKKKQKLKLGYGVRFTNFTGSDQNYTTAPAKIVKDVSGPAALVRPVKPENIDTLFFTKAQVNAINTSFHIQYSFTNRLDVGFNIDLIGFSFGRSRAATLQSTDRPNNLSTMQEARPTSFNILLGAENDIGTLNSEFYGKYWVTKRLAVKLGFSHLFTEYTSKNTLPMDNDRFRNISNLILLGVSFSPYRYIID